MSEPTKVRISFADELMEVIAAVVESMDMTFDDYTAKLTPERIAALHERIMPQFAIIHKRGVEDAKAVFLAARVRK
jgi:hypothetical protein